jgi:hypothetical protein
MATEKQKYTKSGDVTFFEYEKGASSKIDEVVFVWDIDKTYLNTNFDTFRGLLRTAFEKAFQKINVPGTATLIKALEDSNRPKALPLYFISASPPQMEAKIYQKMLIDGVKPYGIFFKDNLKNFRPSKFRRLKQQVGFKIQALLELRLKIKKRVKMVVFGDDSESDAVVYSLFSDICQRRLPNPEILSVLEALHVLPEQRDRIVKLQEQIEVEDPIERIYINLVADTDPDYYRKFGRRVLATFTTFQLALDLFQEKRITSESLVMVAKDMIFNYGFTSEEIGKSLQDLDKRGFLKSETLSMVIPLLKAHGLLPANFSDSFNPVRTLQKIGEKILEAVQATTEDPLVPERIDYLHDFR